MISAGGDVSHLNVLLIAQGKVVRQLSINHIFWREKWDEARSRTCVLLSAYQPIALTTRPSRLTCSLPETVGLFLGVLAAWAEDGHLNSFGETDRNRITLYATGAKQIVSKCFVNGFAADFFFFIPIFEESLDWAWGFEIQTTCGGNGVA